MNNTSKEKRAPTALKVKYKSESIEEFIEQAGLNISRGGIFVRTKKPMAAGTPLKFEFQLSDSTPVIRGVGRVVWSREKDEDKSRPSGMGVKFLKLDPAGRSLVERIVNERGQVRSRFDAKVIEKPTAPQKESSVPPPVPAEARVKAPTTTGPVSARVPEKKQKSQVQDVGEFLASALSESGVEHKPATEPLAPAEEKPKPVEIKPKEKNSSQSLADELFGDIETPTQFAPIIDPASLSKPPRDTERKPAFDADVEAPFESDFGDDDENTKKDVGPLFSDRAPQLSGHAPAPVDALDSEEETIARSGSLDQSSPATPSLDSSSPEHPASSRPSLGPYDADARRSDPAVESSPPPLDATLPLSLSPPRSEPAPSSSSRVFVIGLVICLFIGLIAGGGAYLYLGEDSPLKTSGSETSAVDQTAEPKTAEVASAPEEQPPPVREDPTSKESAEGESEQASEQSEQQAEAEPVEMTKVQITSVPRNADLTIDGEPSGKTPARVELPVGKSVTISVKYSGFELTTREVTAQKREPPIRFKLVPQDYVLLVRTIPPGAKVTVRRQSVISPTPLNLGHINGMISVTLSKEGHRPVVLPVRIDQFEEVDNVMKKQLTVKLTPLPIRRDIDKPKPAPRTATTTPAAPKKTPESKPVVTAPTTPSEKKFLILTPKAEPAPKAEPEPKPEPAPKAKPAPEAEPIPKTEPTPKAEPEPKPEPAPKVETEPQAPLDTKPAPNPY